jgi:hypothetical protein
MVQFIENRALLRSGVLTEQMRKGVGGERGESEEANEGKCKPLWPVTHSGHQEVLVVFQSGYKLIDKQGMGQFPCSWRWRMPGSSTQRTP